MDTLPEVQLDESAYWNLGPAERKRIRAAFNEAYMCGFSPLPFSWVFGWGGHSKVLGQVCFGTPICVASTGLPFVASLLLSLSQLLPWGT